MGGQQPQPQQQQYVQPPASPMPPQQHNQQSPFSNAPQGSPVRPRSAPRGGGSGAPTRPRSANPPAAQGSRRPQQPVGDPRRNGGALGPGGGGGWENSPAAGLLNAAGAMAPPQVPPAYITNDYEELRWQLVRRIVEGELYNEGQMVRMLTAVQDQLVNQAMAGKLPQGRDGTPLDAWKCAKVIADLAGSLELPMDHSLNTFAGRFEFQQQQGAPEESDGYYDDPRLYGGGDPRGGGALGSPGNAGCGGVPPNQGGTM